MKLRNVFISAGLLLVSGACAFTGALASKKELVEVRSGNVSMDGEPRGIGAVFGRARRAPRLQDVRHRNADNHQLRAADAVAARGMRRARSGEQRARRLAARTDRLFVGRGRVQDARAVLATAKRRRP